MSETTEHGMLIERVKELRDRVREANDSPWMTGAYEHDVDTMNEAIAALEQPRYWLPIETAPRDGTAIDVLCVAPEGVDWYGHIRITDVGWHEADDIFPHTGWVKVMPDGNYDLVDGPPTCPYGLPQWIPTHWMPLPEAA